MNRGVEKMAREIDSLIEHRKELEQERLFTKEHYAELGRRMTKCDQEIARIRKKEKSLAEDA